MGESYRFSTPEIAGLRNTLLQSGLDLRDAAEALQLFLMGKGYGVSHDDAREAIKRFGGSGHSLEAMRQELNRIALVQ